MDDNAHEVCDDCQELFEYDDMTYVVTERQTYWLPEEGVLLCDGCLPDDYDG